jgi:hypothetical protein
MEHRITDIHCPQCGAPADFDIVKQIYVCGHCGGTVGITEAQKEKQGFRSLQQEKLKNSAKKYRIFRTSCSGCGAEVVFEENEALSGFPFCERSLVRTEYLSSKEMPECVVPFGITQKEACERLEDWCRKNSSKQEAKQLRHLIPQLKGFYLPYEMVRGPVHMRASRMDSSSVYRCEGFMENAFVNCSKQLDNLLLDGMEPFDLNGLTEFEFGYVAGHHVKTPDIGGKEFAQRVCQEVEECYTPAVRKILETNAVKIEASAESAITMPVLLPVYYICKGDLMAAVNGQTGKVSVRALRESHYYFLPWWLKAILATLVMSGAAYGALYLFGMNLGGSLFITASLAFIFFIVLLCLYSDTTKNRFSVEAGREIYTSGEAAFRRERGKLVQSSKILEKKIVPPVFFSHIEGEDRPVVLRFTTPFRVIRMILLSLTAMFLPVIIALILTGFDFQKINLAGSAVWFCLAVPVVPIYLLKFGIVELHDRPWIYIVSKDGKKKRYRQKPNPKDIKYMLLGFLKALFIPPISLAVWFGIISFFVMVYLTAGGQ